MEANKQLIAVYGCILNQNQEVLIVQRADNDTHPRMWELPGGAVEHGEDPFTATIREVKEETGLTIKPLYPFAISSGFSSKGHHIQVIRTAFLCIMEDTQSIQLSTEHSNYRWITKDSSPDGTLSDLLQHSLKNLNNFPNLLEALR